MANFKYKKIPVAINETVTLVKINRVSNYLLMKHIGNEGKIELPSGEAKPIIYEIPTKTFELMKTIAQRRRLTTNG
jgi:hypothetical protein